MSAKKRGARLIQLKREQRLQAVHMSPRRFFFEHRLT